MTFRDDIRPMLSLAAPLVLAEVGWVTMGLVDTVIVGPLGATAIGAVGVGSVLFLALAVFGMGLLLGLDTLVSHAFGAGRMDECHRWLLHGLFLSLLVMPMLTVIAFAMIALLPAWGLSADVLALTVPYLRVLVWSLLPLLLYASFRRYLQAIGLAKPVTAALISANAINALAAWGLVYGRWGLPAMGTTGSGLATLIARVYMAGFLFAAVLRYDRRHNVSLFSVSWRPKKKSLVRLLRLGLPAAMQATVELGAFAAASALAGRLGAVPLAAHQIIFNLASLTFMVPLGVAAAGAVRVGHAIGRGDLAAAERSGWAALVLGTGFMTCAALVFVIAPRPLIGMFTRDASVLELARRLLLVAALFQVFDGLQGVSTGILRGLGDTRTAMLGNIAGHWLIGLPVGYVLCFWCGWGVIGLWGGLCTGLMAVGGVLVLTWHRRISRFTWELAGPMR